MICTLAPLKSIEPSTPSWFSFADDGWTNTKKSRNLTKTTCFFPNSTLRQKNRDGSISTITFDRVYSRRFCLASLVWSRWRNSRSVQCQVDGATQKPCAFYFFRGVDCDLCRYSVVALTLYTLFAMTMWESAKWPICSAESSQAHSPTVGGERGSLEFLPLEVVAGSRSRSI